MGLIFLVRAIHRSDMNYSIKKTKNYKRVVSGYSRDELKHEPCCAKCRRGMPSYGVLPCGFDGLCGCHLKKVNDERTNAS